ncbi:DUF2917 domain-containing protein [Ideonella sp. BN130291]|uniref:DUF2917 domain-containing protein n=1 Tax=Ideonella sp. BN130291 TaxID=3112940 RepID=UPI002E26AB20|nr:DUF2917 domain-containing protein [Ideonella sp. BN130291]
MNAFHAPATLTLPPRALHTLHDAQGTQITCNEGCLWVTLDHDPRDIVLEAGQSFTVPDARRTLVYALKASRLALQAPRPAPSAKAGGRLFHRTLAAAIAQVMGPGAQAMKATLEGPGR